MNKSKLLGLVFMFLLLSSLALAGEYNISTFENCSDTIFYVDVSSIGNLYEGAYDVSGCDLLFVKEHKHRWTCMCEDSLNISFQTLSPVDSAYSISILGALGDLDYGTIELYENLSLDVDNLIIINESNLTSNLITGAVTGATSAVGITLFGILLLILLILFFIHFMGGAPWMSKYKRAANLHKRGQKAFNSSKHNKAKRYYKRAANLRHKD